MKITRRQNGSITVGFDGWFGLRQAISLPKFVSHLHARAVTLDFSGVRWESESAFAALIPALASLHRPTLKVVGLAAA